MAKPKADRKAPGSKPKAKTPRAPRAKVKAESTGTEVKRTDKGTFAPGYSGGPGRPSMYSEELADAICARLAMGETLIAICRDAGMPHESAVRAWALKLDHPFYPKYARSREIGYLRMADELVDIADDSSDDYIVREDGDGEIRRVFNAEATARSRLKVDTRKWLLSKALPKIYGDKLALTDAEGGILQVRMVV